MKTCNDQLGELDSPLRALSRAISDRPHSTFVDLEGDILTFGDLDKRSSGVAQLLRDRGVKPGDVVVTLLETSLDVFVIWFALAKLRAIWAPINLAYHGELLRQQVNDTGAHLVICDSAYLSYIREIQAGLPDLERVICRGAEPAAVCGPIPVERLKYIVPQSVSFEYSEPAPGDVGLIIFTSGTTGTSKGCMLSHNYLCHIGRQQMTVVPHEAHDRAWTCLPLFHLAALVATMAGLLSKNGIAMAKRFSVSNFWQEIERSGATSATLMANIFPLLAHAPENPAQKRCFGQLKMTTGVPVADDIRRIWHERFGVGLLNTFSYGQTEGNRLAILPMGDPTPPKQSVGRIADEFEVRIVDEFDRQLPDGEVGEIVFRPRKPHVMFEGYWRRPEATLAAWRNLWMHTGDLGRMEQNYLYFCDRKKDYLRNKGENISSMEMESIYLRHPAIAEVAFYALENVGDNQIKISAVLHDGSSMSERELCEWSIDNLPYFAVPRFYEFLPALPRNPTGKVLKYKLRDAGFTQGTWDSEVAGIVPRRRERKQ